MQDQFNTQATAEANARLVTIPAHTANIFDWETYREDGMTGRLRKNMTEEDVHREYYSTQEVPEQVFTFTGWDKVPFGTADDTKALLKRIMAEEDRKTWQAPKEAFVVQRLLRFKNSAGG